MTEEILQELYVGKIKELKEIESLIGKARSRYMGETYTGGMIIFSKEFEKINRLFEDLFGFKNFSLLIDGTSIINAYTRPIAYAIDIAPQFRLQKNLMVSNTGFKYKKEAGYCCIVYITTGMLLNKAFSNAEIVAMILHEIGHNFQSVLNDTHYYFTDCIGAMRFLAVFLEQYVQYGPVKASIDTIGFAAQSSNFAKDFLIKLTDLSVKSPMILSAIGGINLIKSVLIDLNINMSYVVNLFMRHITLPATFVASILKRLFNPLGRSAEQIADSFATIYGYGPDLSSAFNKISEKGAGIEMQNLLYSCPILGQLIASYDLSTEILLTGIDEHPPFISRIGLVKANLTRELKDTSLDPKMKQKILNDIKLVESEMNDYKNLAKIYDYNPRGINASWYVFIYEFTKGDQRQNKVSQRIMGNINKINSNMRLH